MSLNINAKTLLLTYSQVNQDGLHHFCERETAHFDFITQALRAPSGYRLARESHQDGGDHFHVYIAFDSPVRIRTANRLDFGSHHPNIKSVRTGHRRTWDYVGKDGNIIYEYGAEPPDPNDGTTTAGGDSVWSAAASATTEAEFYQIVRDGAPRSFIIYHQQLERYAAKFFSVQPDPYRSPAFSDLSRDRLECWTNQATIGLNGSGHRRRSLILWGPTRTGKTVWARSLGQYVTNPNSLSGGSAPRTPVHIPQYPNSLTLTP